jgi:hypothetical protein
MMLEELECKRRRFAIEHGSFAGRGGFELGNTIEENAPHFCEILRGQVGAGGLFEVLQKRARGEI